MHNVFKFLCGAQSLKHSFVLMKSKGVSSSLTQNDSLEESGLLEVELKVLFSF